HATKGQKNISLEDFNNAIFNEIHKIKTSDAQKECNFAGTIFEGDISFIQKKSTNTFPRINFSDVIFNGNTVFGSDNDFIIFTEEVFFSDTVFNGKVDLSEVEFSKNAYFYNNNF